jgi:MFS family permease
MRAVLKNRDFALLWLGGLISMIGNWILLAALPFYIYEVTGSALASGGLIMAYVAPGILFGSVAGVFVDRWDRRRTMIITSLLQAVVVAVMALASSPDWVWLIYVVVIAEASLGRFFGPAENALLPTLVGEENLVAANSMNALNDNLARLVGPAVGGALLALVGFSAVVVVDVFSYLTAGLLIVLMQAPAAPARVATNVEAETGRFARVWREWIAGLQYVRHSSALKAAFAVIAIALFGDAIISAVLVVFVQDVMQVGATQFGWMLTARGLGGLIGGLLVARLSRLLSPGQLLGGGLLISGALVIAVVQLPQLQIVLPVLLLVGIASLAWIVSLQTIIQQGAENAFRGRVFGALGTTMALLQLLGSGAGGALADLVGSPLLLTAAGVITVAAGLLGVAFLGRTSQGRAAAHNPGASEAPGL